MGSPPCEMSSSVRVESTSRAFGPAMLIAPSAEVWLTMCTVMPQVSRQSIISASASSAPEVVTVR